MSGHSKWHNIQQRKGKQDAARGNVFSKLSKQMMIVVKQAGKDPTTNFSLRLLMDKARVAGMPKDNVERAIKRGAGETDDATQMEECLYEAYGPGGVAIIIKAITDNKNRTTAEIKHLISISGGTFANSGSVAWMFEKCGLIIVPSDQVAQRRDEIEMQMIEAGADDIWEEGGSVYFKMKVTDFKIAMDAIGALNLAPSKSGLEWVAKDKVVVEGANEEKLMNLFSKLEENDDVDDYYTNAE
jgi:YebC/PmpR family DNA-binding regulatory protein